MRLKRDKNSNERSWAKHAGVGIEFAAAVAGFALVGYWIDRHYKSSPWGVLIGAALGLIGGTYNLVRQAMAAFREYDEGTATKSDNDGEDRPASRR